MLNRDVTFNVLPHSWTIQIIFRFFLLSSYCFCYRWSYGWNRFTAAGQMHNPQQPPPPYQPPQPYSMQGTVPHTFGIHSHILQNSTREVRLSPCFDFAHTPMCSKGKIMNNENSYRACHQLQAQECHLRTLTVNHHLIIQWLCKDHDQIFSDHHHLAHRSHPVLRVSLA